MGRRIMYRSLQNFYSTFILKYSQRTISIFLFVLFSSLIFLTSCSFISFTDPVAHALKSRWKFRSWSNSLETRLNKLEKRRTEFQEIRSKLSVEIALLPATQIKQRQLIDETLVSLNRELTDIERRLSKLKIGRMELQKLYPEAKGIYLPEQRHHIEGPFEGKILLDKSKVFRAKLEKKISYLKRLLNEEKPPIDPPIDPLPFDFGADAVVPMVSGSGAMSGGGGSSEPPEPSRPRVVKVFYGTDRKITGDKSTHHFYGDDRGILQFGICKVTIPRHHKVGVLESPTSNISGDPDKHFLLYAVNPMDNNIYFSNLRKEISQSPQKNAFIFIHGYNVTFEDSCRRTAQIAKDLKFKAVPITYSWPSDGKFANYIKDETDIEWSKENFEKFLLMIADKSGASTLHIIAHSMGNRALLYALKSIVDKKDFQKPFFNQVVLMAPDFDSGTFKQIAESVKKASEKTTLYASSNDKALKISSGKFIHGRSRLGLAGPYLTILPGIDTIDASSVDTSLKSFGHSYYSENKSVLTDLYEMMILGVSPENRFHLQPKLWENEHLYWEFRP